MNKKNTLKKLLPLAADLLYGERTGVHTVSKAECGHGLTIGGQRCSQCIMDAMEKVLLRRGKK